MKDIKTKDSSRKGIKTLNKASTWTERIKDPIVYLNDKSNEINSNNNNINEYGSDKIKYYSIYTYDSVFIKSKGDTIYLDKYRYLYKYKFIRDTINIKDTITVSKPIEVEKEVNRVYTWQIILMVIGGGSLGIYLYKLFRNIKI